MLKFNDKIYYIKTIFNTFKNIDDKWKYLIELAKNNKHIDNYDTKFLIEGCSVNMYLIPEYKNHKLYFKCDTKSNSLISLGLCIFACNIFSDLEPKEIINADLSVFDELGFYNGLSPTRNNGFASILAKIKYYAVLYFNYK